MIGGSKGIGLETVKQGLDVGFSVKAMARTADAIALDHPQLEKVTGDATVRDDVAAALRDVDVVVSCLGLPLNRQTITQPTDLFSSSTLVLLEAMRSSNTKRLIAVTGFGAGDCAAQLSRLERIPFRLVFGRIYDDKSRQEELIKASSLDWTIARPGILTRGRRKETYRVLVEPSSWRNGVISRADVAEYIVSAIKDPSTIGTSPVLVY